MCTRVLRLVRWPAVTLLLVFAGALLLAEPLTAAPASQAATATSTPTRTPTAPPCNGNHKITVRPGFDNYGGVSDTYVSIYEPAANFGLDKYLKVRSDGWRQSLVRFELPAFQAGTQIDKAELELFADSRTNANPLTIDLHAMLLPWDASALVWNDRPWAELGAGGAYDPIPATSVPINAGVTRWYTFNITRLVQHWLAAPATNYGVILRRADSWGVEYLFASSEFSRDLGLRPRLIISYYCPGPGMPTRTITPTPTASRTPTPTRTATFTQTATSTRTGTITRTPTATATSTVTATPTETPTATSTLTPTSTPTETPTITPSATPAPTETSTATSTVTPTATMIETPTPTETATATPTATPQAPYQVELILQQGRHGYVGVSDTYINEWFPTHNYGLSDTLRVRSNGAQVALIRFEVPPLPTDAQLVEGRLDLYSVSRSAAQTLNVDVHLLTTAWEAETATWYLPWTYPGAGKDYDDPAITTLPVADTLRWYRFPLTGAVQIWLNEPATNRGMILRQKDFSDVAHDFASSEYADPTLRPRLHIIYRTFAPPAPWRACLPLLLRH